ncbi:hypothetical protein GX48_02672 [Paracoccidioides brasiliensis]|nr:hypothetical protein GX48_02672 [Paracoccidioides brasiliensis]
MSSSNNPEPQSTTSSYVEQASNAIKNTISKVTGGTTSQDDKDKDTAHEWAEGAGDRVTGKVGELLSGPGFGGSDEDRMKAEAERRKFKQMHEEGKLQQKSAEEDIDQRWGGDDK